MGGYVFPNELEVNWGLFIVLYPYITGLVAGAFIASSLYHVFGKSELKPVSRLSLVSAFAFLMVAPMPLMLHLGQPMRAFNILWTPNPTSAMAGFGYIYSFYLIIVLLEIWFMYRQDFVHFAETKRGFAKFGYNMLTLGAKDVSPEALHSDQKIVSVLAIVGIPSAAFLHGYVGFIFGAIKANPWWSTPLMPVIFFLSAIVSGIALLILIYSASCKLRNKEIDFTCLMSLNKYLWSFIILASVLEILEVVHKGYEGKAEWPMIKGLIFNNISTTYFGVQMTLGVLIPFSLLLLGRSERLAVKTRQFLTILSGLLVLIGVFAMRFNVVIGGQLISKSMSGYATFHLKLINDEGIIPTMLLLLLPVVILAVLVRILPPWLGDVNREEERVERNVIPEVVISQ
jgi:Ni/Fe-hydrogenase subunit HybB-like protein